MKSSRKRRHFPHEAARRIARSLSKARQMNTKELVEIMNGVTPPKEWLIKKPGEHAAKNFRLVRSIGVNAGSNKEIFAAIAEISTSRSSEDNYSDTERQRAEFLLRAAQNFEPLVDALMDIEAAGRPHGANPDPCECEQCQAWDAAKVALNNALKP